MKDMYHLNQVPSEAQIRKYVRRIVFGKHVFCPRCTTRKIHTSGDRYWCKQCRLRFSLLSHTWLANCKLPLVQFWLILWCWTKQMPVKQTMAVTHTSEKGIRHWFTLFRTHLPVYQETLEHIVQLDEAYFGGMMGYALLLAKQQGTRKLAYWTLPDNAPNKTEAISFVRRYIKSDTLLHTDGSVIYQGIHHYAPVRHMWDLHNRFEFTQTAEIEGMFGVLRTFIRRMYHHVTRDKFPEHVGEFYSRLSHREMFASPYQYLTKTLTLVPTG